MINGIMYLHHLKVPPHKILINSEGKMNNGKMGKSLRHYLNINVIGNGTDENHLPPDSMQ